MQEKTFLYEIKIFQVLDDKNPNLCVFHKISISNNGVIVEAQFEESLRK